MPRPDRVVIPGLPHHLNHRGNRCQDIFRESEDREIYQRLLRKHAKENGVQINSYTLMSNHVHLVVVPEHEESLSAMIQEAHGPYATIFNGRYGLTGHLWEGRFFSCVLDPSHFWKATRYVERNPVRAGLVRMSENYRWSSAAAHCGLRIDGLLSSHRPLEGLIEDWSTWLARGNPQGVDEYIRQQTFSGHACGSADYFHGLEQTLGIQILPRKRGRPRKMGS